MTLDELRSYSLSKPSTGEKMPFDDEVLTFTVGGKIFLLTNINGRPVSMNVKCDPEKALELREKYSSVTPGYHMNKKHWNTVILDGSITEKEIHAMIDHSYQLVRASLSKAIQATLD